MNIKKKNLKLNNIILDDKIEKKNQFKYKINFFFKKITHMRQGLKKIIFLKNNLEKNVKFK